MYDIFISYSRKDNDIVLKYVDFLEQQGFKVWIDRNGIYSGEAFKSVITKAIIESNIFLFFSSASSNTSPWVEKEIGVAAGSGSGKFQTELGGFRQRHFNHQNLQQYLCGNDIKFVQQCFH